MGRRRKRKIDKNKIVSAVSQLLEETGTSVLQFGDLSDDQFKSLALRLKVSQQIIKDVFLDSQKIRLNEW